MLRYLSQQDQFCCGPIAIVNAFKWLGFSVTAQHLKELRNVCATNTTVGTTVNGMSKGLNFMCDYMGLAKSPFVQVKTLTMDWVVEILRDGWVVLINAGWKRSDGEVQGHYFLIVGMSHSQRNFYVVNGPEGTRGVRRLSRKKLGWIMKHSRSTWPNGWVVRRLNEVRKPRYLCQRDKCGCSPIGIINVFKWLGFPATGRDVQQMKSLCKTNRYGTFDHNMLRGVKHFSDKFGVPIKAFTFYPKITWKLIDDVMSNGDAVLMGFTWNEKSKVSGHTSLLSWRSGDGCLFEVVNHVSTPDGDMSTLYFFRDEIQSAIIGPLSGWIIDHRLALCT